MDNKTLEDKAAADKAAADKAAADKAAIKPLFRYIAKVANVYGGKYYRPGEIIKTDNPTPPSHHFEAVK